MITKMETVAIGQMGVDWEERINYERMRQYRLDRITKAVDDSEADVLFVFRLEGTRYITGLRTHDWPMAHWGMAATVVPKGGNYTLYSLDYGNCKVRMPWRSPDRDHLPRTGACSRRPRLGGGYQAPSGRSGRTSEVHCCGRVEPGSV